MPTDRDDIRKYDEPMERRTLRLPPSMIKHVLELGDGTLSEGVRTCIERDMDDD